MQFLKYPATQNVERGATLYADVVNHCVAYREYLVAGSLASSTHEISHRIHADLRNKSGVPYDIALWVTENRYVLPQPVLLGKFLSLGGVNCFYVGKDRYVTIPEPSFRKSEIAQYIPHELQSARFSQYITGQTAWDATPLYVFDEAVAYTKGAVAQLDLINE